MSMMRPETHKRPDINRYFRGVQVLSYLGSPGAFYSKGKGFKLSGFRVILHYVHQSLTFRQHKVIYNKHLGDLITKGQMWADVNAAKKLWRPIAQIIFRGGPGNIQPLRCYVNVQDHILHSCSLLLTAVSLHFSGNAIVLVLNVLLKST